MKFLRRILDHIMKLGAHRWTPALFFLALLVQVPFSELISWRAQFPFVMRMEEWPFVFLHLYQSLCLFGLFAIFYSRGKSYYFGRAWSWKKEGLAFFFAAFLYWIYWIPLGFDVTDEGRRMAHSWFMYLGLWDMHVDLRMGGHLLQGLWLHILPVPSVLWGRIGYALLKSLMGLLSFLIIRRAFPQRRMEAFLFSYVGLMAVSIYGGQVINYNNVPVTLMLASVHLFQLAGDDGEQRYSARAAFFAGFLIPLAVLSRFPFIIMFAFPLLWQGIAQLQGRIRGRSYLPSMGWTVSGILTGCLSVLLLLGTTDSLGNYWGTIDNKLIQGFLHENDSKLQSHGHDKDSLFSTYSEDLSVLGAVLLRLVPTFLILGVIGRFAGRWRPYVLLLLVLFSYLYLRPIVELDRWHYGVVALPLGLLIFYFLSERTRPPSLFVGYWGIVLFAFSFLGSNNGTINILITGGGILLFAYSLMVLRERRSTHSVRTLDPIPVLGACLIFLPFYVMHKKPHKIYRDGEQEELTRMMGHPALFGVFSMPARVEKVNGLLEATDEHITPYKDVLLAVNTIPIFYYLTESPYAFAKHWEMKGKSDKERERALSGKEGPDHILVLHKDPRAWEWPKVERPCSDGDLPYYRFYVRYLKGSSYREVFDNGCFSLHEKVPLEER